MRVFAGPNGSGKSTIFDKINSNYDVGHYINADKIEKEIKLNHSFNLLPFGLNNIDSSIFGQFLETHSLKVKAESKGYAINASLSEDVIRIDNDSQFSYEAALIADFLRMMLIERGSKLAFETVMSHKSKIEVLDFAITNGYKNYLYFICTESPQINIDRVESRVKQGGHNVSHDAIEKRYYETLSHLREAVKKTYRAFLYDNSLKSSNLILEVFQGKEVTFHTDNVPGWINKYLLTS